MRSISESRVSSPLSIRPKIPTSAQLLAFGTLRKEPRRVRKQRLTSVRQWPAATVEPAALLREQANYVVSFVLAEVGSVGQQRVVARAPSHVMQTEDDPEADRLRGFP
jgi:hypothetical protein